MFYTVTFCIVVEAAGASSESMLFTMQWLLQVNLAAQVCSQTDETVYADMTILSSLGKLRNEDCMKAEFLWNVNTSFDILNVRAFDIKAASPVAQ